MASTSHYTLVIMESRATDSCSLLTWGRSYLRPNSLLTSPQPFTVPFLVKTVACGDDHCVYVTAAGEVYSQGLNSHGALGIRAAGNFFSRQPMLVPGIGKAVSAACGPDHSLCIVQGGEVYAWGLGESGVLGLGDSEDRYEPAVIRLPPGVKAVAVATGARHSALICEKQRRTALFTCGHNSLGQLGLGHTLSQQSFTEVRAAGEVLQAACGFTHTLIISKASTLYATGGNSLGQLGLGHTQAVATPTLVPSLSRVLRAAAGSHSAALLDCGDLYIWGTGPFGAFLTPNQLNPAGTVFREMDLKSHFGLAKDQNDRLWTWGSNTSGQLGLGDYQNRVKLTKTPIEMRLLRLISIGGASVVAVSAEEHQEKPLETLFFESKPGSIASIPTAFPPKEAVSAQFPTEMQTQGTDKELNRLKRTVESLEKELMSSYRDFSLQKRKETLTFPSSSHYFPSNSENNPEISDLKQVLEEQFVLNDELRHSYSHLKVSHEAIEREMLDLARELEAREKASDILQGKYRKLKDAHSKLKLQNVHLMKNYKEETGYKERLKSELSRLEDRLEQTLQKHTEIAILQENLKTLERENDQLRQELTASQIKRQEAENRLLASLQENDSLKTDILRSMDWSKRSKPREEAKKPNKAYSLDTIEEAESSSAPHSSGKRYSDVDSSASDLLEGLGYAQPIAIYPKEADETELKSPDDSVQTLPQGSSSLRSSLSEITSKTKELKRSKTDAEMVKVLRERKRLLGRDSEGEE